MVIIASIEVVSEVVFEWEGGRGDGGVMVVGEGGVGVDVVDFCEKGLEEGRDVKGSTARVFEHDTKRNNVEGRSGIGGGRGKRWFWGLVSVF